MYLEALGNGILVLNTLDAVNDLLEKRANNYSDRPEFVMVGKLWELNKVKTSSAFHTGARFDYDTLNMISAEHSDARIRADIQAAKKTYPSCFEP